MIELFKFFYSKNQTMGNCNPLVKTPDGWKEYSEMRSDGGNSNWEDATLVYEANECPQINTNLCGHCSMCFRLREWLRMETKI